MDTLRQIAAFAVLVALVVTLASVDFPRFGFPDLSGLAAPVAWVIVGVVVFRTMRSGKGCCWGSCRR